MDLVKKYKIEPEDILRRLGDAVHAWKVNRERLFNTAKHMDTVVMIEECLLYFRKNTWADFLPLAVPPER